MRILVTGGNGFLGKYLCQTLLKNGHNVSILDTSISNDRQPDINYEVGSVSDQSILNKMTKDVDCVFHLAALSNIYECNKFPTKAVEANILGTQNVLESIRANNVPRLMFSSSMYALGEKGGIYATTKKTCEALIKNYADTYNFGWTILRFGSIYGPGSPKSNGFYQILHSVLFDKEIKYSGSKETFRRYIHVSDAARICCDALDKDYLYKGVNILGDEKINILNLINLIQEVLNTNKSVLFLEGEKSLQYQHTHYSKNLDSEISLKSNVSVTLEQGISELIDYLRAENSDGNIFKHD